MKKETDKINVLLVSEGTYPYYGGGVSTWSHMLCERVSNVNWHLYSINASYEPKPFWIVSDRYYLGGEFAWKYGNQQPGELYLGADAGAFYDSFTGTFVRLTGSFSFPIKQYVHVNGQFEYFNQDCYYSNGFRFGISYFLDRKKAYTYRRRAYDKLYK